MLNKTNTFCTQTIKQRCAQGVPLSASGIGAGNETLHMSLLAPENSNI